jgi:hypothetical protein
VLKDKDIILLAYNYCKYYRILYIYEQQRTISKHCIVLYDKDIILLTYNYCEHYKILYIYV